MKNTQYEVLKDEGGSKLKFPSEESNRVSIEAPKEPYLIVSTSLNKVKNIDPAIRKYIANITAM